jgi:hypothetical protein
MKGGLKSQNDTVTLTASVEGPAHQETGLTHRRTFGRALRGPVAPFLSIQNRIFLGVVVTVRGLRGGASGFGGGGRRMYRRNRALRRCTL